MKNPARRAVSIFLAAALLLGSAPQGAFAQVARIAVGEAGGMPVAPVGMTPVTGTITPTLSLGASSLTGTLSAPSITPSVAAGLTPSALTATPAAAVASALTSAQVAPAASVEDPKLPETPKAAAPATAKTWGQRLSSLLGRKTSETSGQTPASGPSAETAKADADKTFDGATEKQTANDAEPIAVGKIKITRNGLKSSISDRFNIDKAHDKRKLHVDEFGGPLSEPMSFKARVGYGLRQGLNMVGVAALLDVTLKPLLSLFPWPQYLADSALRGFGRVALLTKFGPNQIFEGLANAPGTFLGISLPMAVTMEEITYRLLGFGLTFLMLAAIKPVTRWLSSMVDGLPDAAGIVGGTKKLLKLGDWLSHLAFPIAAVLSSFNFAVAHFATWGFSPFVLVLNFALGLYLAHTAYKTRGLTAPIVSHLLFNLVTMGAILIGLTFSPMSALAYSIIAGLIGISALVHSYLSNRKLKLFRMKNGAAAMIALLLISGAATTWRGPSNDGLASHHNAATVIQLVQDKKLGDAKPVTETAPVPNTAAADTGVIESRADMVARVKPAVVNPIIHMGNGYALGSGFILTPSGVFVTNGHVVGTKKPGEFINARVPGFPQELKAKVLAVNHDKDLAIVQLQPRPDGKPWPTVKLASVAPREGDEVTALGYPRGLGFSVSHGVISALDGRGTMYVKQLQTDAAINPGNSGGPLFNTRGEVVGVNTEIYTQSGGSEGLGFAIQAPEVAHIMAQFGDTGNIATASLGIITNLSDPMAPEAGLEVEYVRHGSAAEKAGIQRGDLIIGVGEAGIEEGGQEAAGHIAAVLSKMVPGQKVTITIIRGDEPQEITLVADAKVTTAPSH